MPDIFDLEKRQKAVNFVLAKRQVTKPPVLRVGAALDVSGSAKPLYLNGTMQKTIDRLVPVAMKFDDNGEMDVWVFHSESQQIASVTKQDMDDYVRREVLQKPGVSLWGGTKYAPPLTGMQQFYFGGGKQAAAGGGFMSKLFGKKPEPVAQASGGNQTPAMALLITDGSNTDRSETERFLRASVGLPVYWQMVGVGPDVSEFEFIEEMADALPNVGFVSLASLDISDEALYDALLTQELCDWAKKY